MIPKKMLRLTAERLRRSLNQADLARLSGLSQPTLSMIERQRFIPWPGQLGKLAEALNWPAADAEALLDLVKVEIQVEEVTRDA